MEERRAAAMAAEQEDKQGQQLPTESSPYTRYKDLEDYKLQGYGTQGYQPPVDHPRRGGGTDAPTLSGSGPSQAQATQAQAMDTINRQGVP
ncbi:hypothetical protein COCNU_12G008510 [Cocos nucifera]|uniref:Uncharacterized protein n=1 Tax=Cocos nucifera TaxID=13894 RepID=A0A8K0ISL6_COCNU|nr:hypothetical protein COCNU_12G008500 [Cocos nucifera]KAG1365851.1 hypothetical protein COCNU_12G008510 [Cocos nucifera]